MTQSAYHGAIVKQPVALPDPVTTLMPHLQPNRLRYFWGALVGGVLGLIGLTIVTVNTRSVTLEDIFIVAGSLLVPVLFIFYLDLRNRFADVRWRTIAVTFLLGALVSVPVAILLETLIPSGTGSLWPALRTGLIEEACKLLAVLWLLRRAHRYLQFEMDGIILGAAAGMGFAALEDMLYGASAFSHGLSEVVVVVWLRVILGAFGHGTWTAIVAGAIWRAKGNGAPRITPLVIGAYLVASTLHGLWDWLPFPGIAGLLWFVLVGVVGLLILRTMIHQALHQEQDYLNQMQAPAQPLPDQAGPA